MHVQINVCFRLKITIKRCGQKEIYMGIYFLTIQGAGVGYYLFGALRLSIQARESYDMACINGDQSTTVSSLPDEPIMS